MFGGHEQVPVSFVLFSTFPFEEELTAPRYGNVMSDESMTNSPHQSTSRYNYITKLGKCEDEAIAILIYIQNN